MPRGELEAKELQARRAYAAAPKDVSAELKDTAQAEADQRQAAAEATAQGDQATAMALHSLADLLATQKVALEAGHAEHENWTAQTAGLREDGGKARAELARRGQAAEAKPQETMLEWWRRFEHDCQVFEQHLDSLKAQAEAEGQPWPPQPAAEREVSPEIERGGEAHLNAEIPDQASYEPEPEPDMPEASAEI
jgi:glucose repression mediator protein